MLGKNVQMLVDWDNPPEWALARPVQRRQPVTFTADQVLDLVEKVRVAYHTGYADVALDVLEQEVKYAADCAAALTRA